MERNYFTINLHESMGLGWDRTRDPSVCSQTHYKLPYGAWWGKIFFVAVFLGYNQYWLGGFMLFWSFYVQEHPKAQPAVVLGLKRLGRQGHGLKSHPTDWEKLGTKPAAPGLQDIGLSLHHGCLVRQSINNKNNLIVIFFYNIIYIYYKILFISGTLTSHITWNENL